MGGNLVKKMVLIFFLVINFGTKNCRTEYWFNMKNFLKGFKWKVEPNNAIIRKRFINFAWV